VTELQDPIDAGNGLPSPQNEPTTVGAVAAEMFKAYEVENLFLLTGGDNAFLFELRDRGVDLVLARSERASAFMADAYARVTQRPAFVYGQFGPGAMVVASGLIDAAYGRSPVIAIASETSQAVRERFAYQELDQVSLFRPLVNWAGRVDTGERLPDLFRTAVREAVLAPTGPSYLGIPTDLLLAPTRSVADVYAEPACLRVGAHPVIPAAGDLERLAAELAQANRPIVLAGGGVVAAGAWDALTALADELSLPVVTTVAGKGSIAETHEHAHGVAGRYSRVSANKIVRQADLILAIGTRLNDMTTDRGRAFEADPRLIHVDSDSHVLGRTEREHLAIVGDARLVLHGLRAACAELPGWPEWAAHAADITAAWRAQRAAAEQVTSADGVTPAAVVAALRKVLGPTDLIVADTGHMAAWTSALYDAAAGVNHVRTAGSLGWAVPAALGAQLGRQNDRVACVTGDGGIGYHLAELETAVRRNLPIVIVLMNNGTLGFEYQVQRKRLGRVDPSFIDFTEVDYGAIAQACGAYGSTVHPGDDVEEAIRAAFDTSLPALVDIRIDRAANAPVTNFEDLEERLV
jgi:acetolactate synthase-1/2/3 large subunit